MDSSFTSIKGEQQLIPQSNQSSNKRKPEQYLTDPLRDIMNLFSTNPELMNQASTSDAIKEFDVSKWQNIQASSVLNPTEQQPSQDPDSTSSLTESVVSSMLSSGSKADLTSLTSISPLIASGPIGMSILQMVPQAIGWLMKLYDQKVISDMYDIDTEQGRAKLVNAISNIRISGHNAMGSENMGEQINRNIIGLRDSGRNIEFAKAIKFRGG